MRTRSIPIIAAIALFGCASTASAQTGDEILEKSVAALGGRASFAKLRSRRTAGAITLQTPAGEVGGTIEVLNAAPNKVRTLIKADLTSLGAGELVIDQRFDGAKGYVLDTLQGNRDITGNQLDNMRNGAFPHVFLKYKDLGITAKMLGRENAGGRELLIVALEPTAGSIVKHFIDATTFLPARSVIKVDVPQLGQEIEQTTEFSDYRDVDGVKIPFRLHVSSSVQGYTVALATVEHNVAVDEALFVKP